jgi:hypothetical protein
MKPQSIQLKVTGILSCHRIYGTPDVALSPVELRNAVRKGHARMSFLKKNLIVNIGLQVFSRMLGNNLGGPLINGAGFSAIPDIAVGKMQLGTAVSPPSPAPTDTTGVSALAYTPVLVATYPTDYSIQFQGLLPTTEGNGSTFTEEALLLRNGLLFAKTTFSEAKTGAFALQFAHTFTFSL